MNLLRIAKVFFSNGHNNRVCMVAMISKGGNILSTGINKVDRKKFPFKIRNQYPHYAGLHAEMNAINKCTKNQLSNASIIIIGISSAGNLLKSKPCKACMNAIKAVGIKKVTYFDKTGQKFVEKL